MYIYKVLLHAILSLHPSEVNFDVWIIQSHMMARMLNRANIKSVTFSTLFQVTLSPHPPARANLAAAGQCFHGSHVRLTSHLYCCCSYLDSHGFGFW